MNAPFMEADGEAINARAVFVAPYPEHVAELGEIAMLDAFEIGDNPDEWDRYTAEAIEGAAVYLVLPEEVRPSVSKQDLVRALSRFTREHGASLAIVDNYNVLGSAGYFETSAEAVEKAIPAADWLKATRKNLGRWAPVMLDDCDPSTRTEYLIKGVLPARGIAIVFGDSGCGKTFAVSDMAFHIAEGEDWRGLRTQRRGVMWIAAEAPEGMKKRLFALRQRKRFKDRPTPFAMFPIAPDLRTGAADRKELVEAITQTAQGFDDPVGLIVIDTLAQVLNGGSDVTMEDMGAVLANAREIERATGALVLLVHHSGHAEKDRMRGHSSLHAAADAVLSVKADPETKLRTISLAKLKDGEAGTSWSFELEQVKLGTDEDGDPITTCLVNPRDDVPLTPPKPSRRAASQGEIDRNFVLETLRDVISKSGGKPPSSVTTCRHKSEVVTRDAWRDACYSRGFRADDRDAARRSAFWRASSTLYNDGLAIEDGGFVSLGRQK